MLPGCISFLFFFILFGTKKIRILNIRMMICFFFYHINIKQCLWIVNIYHILPELERYIKSLLCLLISGTDELMLAIYRAIYDQSR